MAPKTLPISKRTQESRALARLSVSLWVVVALALAFTPFARAELPLDPALEQEAQWVFGQVYSPFCPGKLLRDCPSASASDLKKEIRQKIDTGRSREEVLLDLYTIYGDDISAVPRTTGFGLVAWLGPIVFVLVGFLGLLQWLKLKRRQDTGAEVTRADNSDLSEAQQDTISALINE